jgi:hypothetical protein
MTLEAAIQANDLAARIESENELASEQRRLRLSTQRSNFAAMTTAA